MFHYFSNGQWAAMYKYSTSNEMCLQPLQKPSLSLFLVHSQFVSQIFINHQIGQHLANRVATPVCHQTCWSCLPIPSCSLCRLVMSLPPPPLLRAHCIGSSCRYCHCMLVASARRVAATTTTATCSSCCLVVFTATATTAACSSHHLIMLLPLCAHRI